MATAPLPVSTIAPEQFREAAMTIEREVGKVIVGQRALIRQTLVTLLAGGNALLEVCRAWPRRRWSARWPT